MDSEDSLIAAHVQHLAVLLRHSGKRMYGRAAGVTGTEYPIVTILVRGEHTIGQICNRLDRDKSHVSRDIASLVSRGLVTKGRATTDARQIVVRLDPAVREAMVKVIEERAKRLTAGLAKEDFETFQRVLTIMIHNAQDMRNDL
jgi:DNA-binding MarR family transcriptional regulator